MSIKSDFFENTLKSAFDITRFVSFSKEFFNNITLIRPDKFMEDGWNWSEFNYYVKGYYHIANFSGSDKSKIAVFAVEMKNYRNIDKARSIQRNFIKKLLVAGGMDAGIIAFYSSEEPKWRLSFIKIDYEFAKGKATEKLTPAKRYSYLVGDGEPCHTAMERLYPIFMNEKVNPTLNEIEDAFSVEKVTKEFFEKYKEKYFQLKDHLDENEDFTLEAERLHFTSEQFSKKLMGQLAFLYFIQKKGWLGVNSFPKQLNASEFKKAYYRLGKASREVLPKVYKQISDDEFVRSGNEIDKLSVEDQEVLAASVNGQPWGTGPKNFIRQLFKVCSNKGANFFDDYLEPLFYEALNEKRGANDYYAKLKCRVPFLNGGLFEAIDNYDWNRNDFQIPNEMFSNIHEKGKDKADGILDIFDRYNFTMNEDEPLEKEVAVDPEMLGKIFESLLDVRDRKSKGAFYTPREIVHYMCQESLANYLSNTTGISYEAIKDFIVYGEFYKDEDTNHRVKKGLEDTVIPKEIFDMKNSVNRLKDIDDALVNIRIADPAVGSGAFSLGMLSEVVKIRRIITEYFVMLTDNKMRIKMLYDSERHPLVLKLQTIKNSIFAVDIDPSAVDITKLRLWLSLVVEQDTDENAEDEGIFAITRNPKPLPNLDCNIRCGNSLVDELDGIKLINESDLFGKAEGQIIINQNKYDSLLKQLFDIQDKLFYEKKHDTKDELKRKINIIMDSIIHFSLENSKPEVIQKYKTTKDNHSLPYFLWRLEFAKVFVEKGGFDIVIGNPPYVDSENMVKYSPEFRAICNKNYLSAKGNWDLFVLFVELGYLISNSNANVSFIIPNKIIAADYAKSIREIMKENSINEIRDYSNVNVFKEAAVYPVTFLSNKRKNNGIVKMVVMGDITDVEWENEIELEAFNKANSWDSYFAKNNKTSGIIDKILEYPKLDVLAEVKGAATVSEAYEIKKMLFNCEEYSDEYFKFINTGTIDPYMTTWSTSKTQYIKHAFYKPVISRVELKQKYPKRYNDSINEKIVIGGMTKVLECYYDSGECLAGKSTTVVLRKNVSLKYIIGVLNSTLISKFYKIYFNSLSLAGGFYRIGAPQIKLIPIAEPSEDQEREVIGIVEQIIDMKKEDRATDIKELQNKLDSCIYAVYKLSKDEITILEEI